MIQNSIAKQFASHGLSYGKNPDHFKRAGIVVDVIDSSTNKLVYRNSATGDVVTGASDSTRSARIDIVVG